MAEPRGQKGAKRGYRCQDLFISLVNSDQHFNQGLRKALGAVCDALNASKPSNPREKADAIIKLLPSQEEIGCSIKEAEADFNQLERVWLKDLALSIGMPGDIKAMIQVCLDDRRLKKSKIFITDKYSEPILNYFRKNADTLLNKLFTGNDTSVKYLVIFDYAKNIWYLSAIEDVIDYIVSQPIKISRLGVVYFGDILTMQRKGGNGVHVKVPKTHPSHPGNQLQFKVKPLLLAEHCNSIRIV